MCKGGLREREEGRERKGGEGRREGLRERRKRDGVNYFDNLF